MLVLTYIVTGDTWFDSVMTGLPIKATWSQGFAVKDWYGYVTEISKVVTSQKQTTMEMHCVGASWPLKDRDNLVFTNTTIPDAVEKIAKKFQLAYVGDPHPWVFPQLSMAGHSYWGWLQEQADRIGYGAYVDGSTLYFRSLDKLIDQDFSSAATLVFDNAGTAFGNQLFDRTLDYFKAHKTTYSEAGNTLRTSKTTYGVSPTDSVSLSALRSPETAGVGLRETKSAPFFSEYRSDQVVHSVETAKYAAQAAAQKARFNLPAVIRGQGDVMLKPYAPVNIRGTGNLTDGYWVIDKITHTWELKGTYNFEATVLTDGLDETISTSFRKRNKVDAGTINITEAIRNNGRVLGRTDGLSTVLRSNYVSPAATQYGFSVTPSLWVSTKV